MKELIQQETKQAKALRQFEKLRPELLKLFLGAPDYGTTSIAVYFFEGEYTRVMHGFEASFIPEGNEHSCVIEKRAKYRGGTHE